MIRIFITIWVAGLMACQLRAESAPKIVALEKGLVCVRTDRIGNDLTAQIQDQSTNKLLGLVLDLRFAGGEAPVSAGDFLLARAVPVVVLVNSQTRGAVADWVGDLRSKSRICVIGGTNVTGKITPDVIVATSSEQDRKYQENPYVAADKPASLAGNRDILPFIDHTTEAELVRRRAKDGDEDVAETPRSQPEQPVIRDPALARAVDLLKALALLNKSRG